MRVNLEEGFNPFYDSKFRISIEGGNAPENRMLVELYNDELLRLKSEIDDLLDRMGFNIQVDESVIEEFNNIGFPNPIPPDRLRAALSRKDNYG